MKRSALFLAAVVLVGGAVSGAEASAPPQRTISVTGTTVVRTTPDLITWHIQTTDANRDIVRAKQDSDQKLKKILALRGELGVKPDDVQTGHLSIRREYERDQRGNPIRFKHFVVHRSVTMKQRDLKRFDEFLTQLVSSTEMEVSFNFESSRVHELRTNTRIKALEVARQKAVAMTKTLGAKLGKVQTITEHQPQPFTRSYASNTAFADVGGQPAVDVASGTFAPGAIEVRISVHVTFEIE